MKDHPTPTKEQMEEAEEILDPFFTKDGPSRQLFGVLRNRIASLLARREAQAEKRGSEKMARTCCPHRAACPNREDV